MFLFMLTWFNRCHCPSSPVCWWFQGEERCVGCGWSIDAVHVFSAFTVHILLKMQPAHWTFCYGSVVTQDKLLHFKSIACGYRDVDLQYLIHCSHCGFRQNFCKTANETNLTYRNEHLLSHNFNFSVCCRLLN